MSLADSRPRLHYPKLPFWDTVGKSYSAFFSNFVEILRVSWLWLLVIAALTGVAGWDLLSWMAACIANTQELSPPFKVGLIMFLGDPLIFIAGVSIAVAWHRLVILNEHPGFSGSNLATKNLWRYIVPGVALVLLEYVPSGMVALLSTNFLSSSGSAKAWELCLTLLVIVCWLVSI